MLFDEPTDRARSHYGQTILNAEDSCHKRLPFYRIIVTHEIPGYLRSVDKVAMIHEGVILFEGTPEEILSSERYEVQCRSIKGAWNGSPMI